MMTQAKPYGAAGAIICEPCMFEKLQRMPIVWTYYALSGDCEKCGAVDVRTFMVDALALVRHPEYFDGPIDPDWDRSLRRMMLIEGLKDAKTFDEGWRRGYLECRRRMEEMGVQFAGRSFRSTDDPRCPFPDVRDYLRDLGYSAIDAQRIALHVSAEPEDRSSYSL